MKSRHRSIRHRSIVTLGAAIIGIGAFAVAETVVVQVQSLVIRSGKGSMHAVVAEVPASTTLEIVERQPDGWLKVKAGDKEGFIREGALKPRSAGILGGASAGMNTITGNTSDVGATAAARGIRDDAIAYATSKGYKTDALSQMIQNRNRVAGETWTKFTQDGNVGPAK